MFQMWIYLLVILLSSSQILSSSLEGSDKVGSCRYEKTSVAVFSCLEPDGKWRPPSTTCCKALLYAIDDLPDRGERGACCLCRYLRRKFTEGSFGLSASYVTCQGKDEQIVSRWTTFPITSCHKECSERNNSSPAKKSPPVARKHGVGKYTFKILLTAAVMAFCIIISVYFWYFWWYKAAPNAPKSQSLPQSGPLVEVRRLSGRHPSAQRRMSSSYSRASPNS